MKKLFFIIFATMPFILGMGTGSGNVTHRIPKPDKNYAAVITDSQGFKTEVTQISFDGRSYLTGYRGNATVTIPFEKIATVEAGKSDKEKNVMTSVTMKDGGTLSIKVDGKLMCYGSADFGNVQIEFRDVRKVEMKGPAPKD